MSADLSRRSVLAGIAALGPATHALAQSPMGLARGPVKPTWQSLVDHYRYAD